MTALGTLVLGGEGYEVTVPMRGWRLGIERTGRGGVTVTAWLTGRDYDLDQDQREFRVTSADLAMALALVGREISKRETEEADRVDAMLYPHLRVQR